MKRYSETGTYRMEDKCNLFKNKGDVQSCRNCRGITMMSHTIKVKKTVFKAKLQRKVAISEQHVSSMAPC